MEKQCLSDGTWFVSRVTNSTWTNFTACPLSPESDRTPLPDEHLTMINYTDDDVMKVAVERPTMA